MNKIFWIPKHKLSYIYYVLLIIAISRITIAAADNILQFLIVVLFVLLVFNVVPFQIFKFFKYLFKTEKKKKKNSKQNIVRLTLIIFLIIIVILILYSNNDNQSLIYRCADAKYQEHYKDKEKQDEIDTFLSLRQNTKNQDQTYNIGITLCEEIYKLHKEEFLKEYSER